MSIDGATHLEHVLDTAEALAGQLAFADPPVEEIVVGIGRRAALFT